MDDSTSSEIVTYFSMDDPDDYEYMPSSDEDEENEGHPVEDKQVVLQNLANGFKYHKNGPAQPYDWTKDDMKYMSRLISDTSKRVSKGRKKIRAVKYDGTPFPGGLLAWVNGVRNGTYFSDNPKIQRGPVFKSGEKSNFWLWNFVSETLLAEVDYWSKVHKENQTVDPSQARYPDINQLIFRDKEDFVGGLWCDFEKHWQKFVAEMR